MESSWAGGGGVLDGGVAKQGLEMSLLLMLNILKPEEQLATEYVETTAAALLFCSHWHSAFLGCIHSEELGEALLSRFSAHCRCNTACTSVQKSSHLFVTLPPVQPGEKVLRGVLTERSVLMFSANLKQFILIAHTQSLPICVPVPDYKVEVRRLDAVEDVSFPGTMSRTRITTDRLKVVLLHAMQNLVARTGVPEGVEDFSQKNAPARTAAQQGVLRTAHASIRAANRAPPAAPARIALPPKPPPKPRARAPPVPPPSPPIPDHAPRPSQLHSRTKVPMLKAAGQYVYSKALRANNIRKPLRWMGVKSRWLLSRAVTRSSSLPLLDGVASMSPSNVFSIWMTLTLRGRIDPT